MSNVLYVKKVKEHYEIFLNNKFYCSCDLNEIKSELKNIKKMYCITEINML